VPTLIVALMPALLVVSLYREERAPFSLRAYAPTSRAEPPSRHDVILDPARPDLAVDLDLPAGAGPHPFVLVVHGGAWRSGDKGAMRHVSRALARAGHVVVDVRYRLAPANRFPAAVADVKCVLGRVRQRAAELAIDPDRGALLGRSAGRSPGNARVHRRAQCRDRSRVECRARAEPGRGPSEGQSLPGGHW